MAASINVPLHHVRGETCSTRPTYREGRNPKAVKVYTVNLESSYLLVQGVPAVGATQELIKLFALYGTISEYRFLDEYPTADEFTDVYLIKFERIQAARVARRKLDDWSFFGGILHVCYAPEHESVEETRLKLQDRRKAIAARIRKNEAENGKPRVNNSGTSNQSQSAISGQRSSCQSQRSNQWSKDEQSDIKSFQGSKSSETLVPVERTFTRRPADGTHESDTHVPLPPSKTDVLPFEEEQQIWIPPPPKEVACRENSHHSMSNYEFARVRTAHSVYPANYDARISTDSNETKSYPGAYTQQKWEENPDKISKTNKDFKDRLQKQNVSKGDNAYITKQKEVCNKRDTDQSIAKYSEVKTKAGVVVRTFKPQTAPPKFVPRQMMNLSKRSVHKSVDAQKDELNKELRQNALKLGELHGPVPQGQDRVQESVKPTEAEESMEKTRSQIRKRISEITTAEESVAKKAKPS